MSSQVRQTDVVGVPVRGLSSSGQAAVPSLRESYCLSIYSRLKYTTKRRRIRTKAHRRPVDRQIGLESRRSSDQEASEFRRQPRHRVVACSQQPYRCGFVALLCEKWITKHCAIEGRISIDMLEKSLKGHISPFLCSFQQQSLKFWLELDVTQTCTISRQIGVEGSVRMGTFSLNDLYPIHPLECAHHFSRERTMVPTEPMRFRVGFTMPCMPGLIRQIDELENSRTSIDRAAMIDERLESLA